MDDRFMTFDQIKNLFPEMENTSVAGGVAIFHSKDKKEVCYIGRDKAVGFGRFTIAFAGDLKQNRRVEILGRL